MGNGKEAKPFDLKERSPLFAQNVRALLKMLPRTIGNVEDGRQLVRASGSVGANYIEANDALSKKDFLLRAKVRRREARESRFFLRLLDVRERAEAERCRQALVAEVGELMSILSAMIRNAESG
jgi:four helix bundle protein